MSNDAVPLKEISIKDLFLDKEFNFKIPVYQRNYAWKKDEIKTLINDIRDVFSDHGHPIYYIGTLVTSRKDDDCFEIIDGQQRLTTIRLILAALLELGELKGLSVKSSLSFEARTASTNAMKALPENSGDTFSFNHKSKEPEGPKEPVEQSICDGYKIAKQQITKLLDSLDKEKLPFIEFFLNNVHVIHYQILQNVDLNHFFETMNSRGEQLEQHEIVKAMVLGCLQDDYNLRKLANYIWDGCFEMNSYIQNNLSKIKLDDKVTLASRLFGDSYDSLFKDGTIDKLSITFSGSDNTSDEQKIGFLEILDDKNAEIAAQKNNDDENNGEFLPIIDFPNFLLIVLKITCSSDVIAQDDKNKITLDDKKLITYFKLYLKGEFDKESKNPKERAVLFITNLLKARFFLDNYTVHHSLHLEEKNSPPWKLQVLKEVEDNKQRKSKRPFNLFDENQKPKQDELVQLLSMFEVTYSSKSGKNYLFYILKFLLSKKTRLLSCEDIRDKYFNFVKNLAFYYLNFVYFGYVIGDNASQQSKVKFDKNYFDNKILADADVFDDLSDDDFLSNQKYSNSKIKEGCLKLNVFGDVENQRAQDISLFIFNYLDYKLWKVYFEKFKGVSDSTDKQKQSLVVFGCEKLNFSNFEGFYFSSTRGSLEHYLPQTYDDLQDPKYDIHINCLGNYAMIGSEANSSGSNCDPLLKVEIYNKHYSVSTSSLKFIIMMKICENARGWGVDQIRDHQERMINILFD